MDSAGLLSFPIEILHHISKFLVGEDLLNLSQTCRYLHNALNDDSVWRMFAPESIAELETHKQLSEPILSLKDGPLYYCKNRELFMMSRHILSNWSRSNYVNTKRVKPKRRHTQIRSLYVPQETTQVVFNDKYMFLECCRDRQGIEVWDISKEPFLHSFLGVLRYASDLYYVLCSKLVVTQCRGVSVYDIIESATEFPLLFSFIYTEVNVSWDKSADHQDECDDRCLSWSHYNAGQYLGSIKDSVGENILHVWDILNAWKLGSFVIPVPGYRPNMRVFCHEGDQWILRHVPCDDEPNYCSYLFNVKKGTFSKTVFKNQFHEENLTFYKSHVLLFKDTDSPNSQGLYDSLCILYDFQTLHEIKRRRFNNAGKQLKMESISIINGSFIVLCFDCFQIVDALTLETIDHIQCDFDIRHITHQFSVFGSVFIVAIGGDSMLYMWDVKNKKKLSRSLGVAYTCNLYCSRNFAKLVMFYNRGRGLNILHFW